MRELDVKEDEAELLSRQLGMDRPERVEGEHLMIASLCEHVHFDITGGFRL